MTKIKLTIELDLENERSGILKNILLAPDATIGQELTPYLMAACHEYFDMFTEVAPITTASDVRERRLAAIILHGLRKVPQASLVAKLFKIPDTAASNLLRTVSAKHQDRIGAIYRAEMLAIVAAAKLDTAKKDGRFYVVIQDAGQVNAL